MAQRNTSQSIIEKVLLTISGIRSKKIEFPEYEIPEFCYCTQDPNDLHNPDAMAEHGKKAIVPGMLTLCRALQLIKESVNAPTNEILGFNRLDVAFLNKLYADETADIVARYDTTNEEKVILTVWKRLTPDESERRKTERGKGVKRMGNMVLEARLYEGEALHPHPTPRRVDADVDADTREKEGEFGRLLGANGRFRTLLYAIASASGAAYRYASEGPDEELRRALDKGKLPVYQHFKIDLKNTSSNGGPLQYQTTIRPEGKLHIVDITCKQGEEPENAPLYTARLKTRLMSKKLLLR